MQIEHLSYSMAKGLSMVKTIDVPKVKLKISKLTGANDRHCLSRKINHYRDIPHHIYMDITSLFESYGVPADQVWTTKKIRK